MIQGRVRTHASEARTHNTEKCKQASPTTQVSGKRQDANTTLHVKMKVVKKTKNSKTTNGEIQADKMGRDMAMGLHQRGGNIKQTALLQVPSDERLRRRLSDSLELNKPTPRVRRRSVSFDPLTVFKTAILENDVETAKSVLISGKVNANSCLDGVLPVIIAAKEGCAECLELLVEKGASIDVCDKRGFTPLELAVQGGHFDCAQVLIAAGANANSIRDGYFDESIENGRHSTGRSRSDLPLYSALMSMFDIPVCFHKNEVEAMSQYNGTAPVSANDVYKFVVHSYPQLHPVCFKIQQS